MDLLLPFFKGYLPNFFKVPPRYLVFPERLPLPASSSHRQFLQALPTTSAVGMVLWLGRSQSLFQGHLAKCPYCHRTGLCSHIRHTVNPWTSGHSCHLWKWLPMTSGFGTGQGFFGPPLTCPCHRSCRWQAATQLLEAGEWLQGCQVELCSLWRAHCKNPPSAASVPFSKGAGGASSFSASFFFISSSILEKGRSSSSGYQPTLSSPFPGARLACPAPSFATPVFSLFQGCCCFCLSLQRQQTWGWLSQTLQTFGLNKGFGSWWGCAWPSSSFSSFFWGHCSLPFLPFHKGQSAPFPTAPTPKSAPTSHHPFPKSAPTCPFAKHWTTSLHPFAKNCCPAGQGCPSSPYSFWVVLLPFWQLYLGEVVPFPIFFPALFRPSLEARSFLFCFHIHEGWDAESLMPGQGFPLHILHLCIKGLVQPCWLFGGHHPFFKGIRFSRVPLSKGRWV